MLLLTEEVGGDQGGVGSAIADDLSRGDNNELDEDRLAEEDGSTYENF